eukprot:645777_1
MARSFTCSMSEDNAASAKKWIHCFEGVTAVLFIAAISEFDQLLVEDGCTNRMKESLDVFNDITANRWFKKSDLILFLNKTDLLEQKLLQGSKFQTHFPDYKGAEDFDTVSK